MFFFAYYSDHLGEPLRGRVAPTRVGLSAPSPARASPIAGGSATIPLAKKTVKIIDFHRFFN
jgi:hypothetical protein